MKRGVAITGSGSAHLPTVLTNDQLSQFVDTSDEWITTRTGIQQRRLVASGGSLQAIAAAAASAAIAAADITPLDVDLIILATSTPDDLFGSASQVQARVGAMRAAAFDLTAACSGFVFALVTAAQYIRAGAYQTVVVIGGDLLSRWTDWTDRRTCVLFGDGAGAVVLQASEVDHLLGFELCSDGSMNECLTLAYHGEERSLLEDTTVQQGTYRPITMNGREVYKFAVKRVPEVIEKALFRAELTSADLDWLVLHQANQRILEAVGERLKVAPERVVSNIARMGNTSAATIPLALDELVREGRLQAGQKIAFSGFGAGLTWGAAIFEWSGER